ncbi:Ubiquinone/menaquinone biosynthesis C-methyltransferase UbiE [Pelotomaculum propionicicum]|uniref:Ubiquinone/menaquinone biosynthesis C-methyltransferase UbiE n=2 Tax=Pelotomaculum propionicicum TaxID=258475 RepID=A0A4Y7RCG2_9FIRM|nr:Ubiquinone/menaquinone biosynthesis C-methyltransferase UbiE [Pelotomaculum propionicicum]
MIMHPANRILSMAGLRLIKASPSKVPGAFLSNYKKNLERLKKEPGAFNVLEQMYYDAGDHPENYIDYECIFTSKHINKIKPNNILDIGSYRHFLIGLLSYYPVTSIDVRERLPLSDNETVVTCDAKKLAIPDNSFDIVTSLCAIEHFGLGRYGDEFDVNADKKAISEMIRVIKPGGYFIFTTTITNAPPSIVFNAHRIYSHDMIKKFCSNLILIEEIAFSHNINDFCAINKATSEPYIWDVYCGCWRKPI